MGLGFILRIGLGLPIVIGAFYWRDVHRYRCFGDLQVVETNSLGLREHALEAQA
jgi:hypothetical protein